MAKTKKKTSKADDDEEMVDVGKAKNLKNTKTEKEQPKKTKELPKKKKQEEPEDDDDDDDDDDVDEELEEDEDEESTPKTTNGVDSKKRKGETPNSPQKQPKTDLHEIFVGNLSYQSTLEKCRKMFEECGEVVNIDWKLDSTEKFRGFCYVQYKDDASLLKALKEMSEKMVDGRPLKVTLSKGAPSYEESKPTSTLFLGNLPTDSQVSTIKDFFEKYGTVKDIRLVNDRLTGEFKRACFIEFDSADTATKIFDSQPISFKSSELKVDYAVPFSEKPKPLGAPRGGRGGFRGGRGGFRGGRGGRGGR